MAMQYLQAATEAATWRYDGLARPGHSATGTSGRFVPPEVIILSAASINRVI